MKSTNYEPPGLFKTIEWTNEWWMDDDEANSVRICLSADLACQKPVGKREQISKDEKANKQNTKQM